MQLEWRHIPFDSSSISWVHFTRSSLPYASKLIQIILVMLATNATLARSFSILCLPRACVIGEFNYRDNILGVIYGKWCIKLIVMINIT